MDNETTHVIAALVGVILAGLIMAGFAHFCLGPILDFIARLKEKAGDK
jgi:hypothetical protein